MGSPTSSPLAELKLRILEEKLLKENQNAIVFWKRYVDDIFAIINSNFEPEYILEKINRADPNKVYIRERN